LRATLLAALPAMSDHKEELRELDAMLGDGDLGITVSDGSQSVVQSLQALPEDADAASIIRSAAAAFAAANPSTFAALVGTGLLGTLDALGSADDVVPSELGTIVQAFTDRIAARGGAEPGDKTLIDVLLPLSNALQQASFTGEEIVNVARVAVDQTSQLQSRRGRAAWQGERSIGQRDPGSVAILRFTEELVRAQRV
jgi:dihydroxyacetone kinase